MKRCWAVCHLLTAPAAIAQEGNDPLAQTGIKPGETFASMHTGEELIGRALSTPSIIERKRSCISGAED